MMVLGDGHVLSKSFSEILEESDWVVRKTMLARCFGPCLILFVIFVLVIPFLLSEKVTIGVEFKLLIFIF